MSLRVAILCNDRLCLPAVNWLVESGIVVAVGMSNQSHETKILVEQLCARKQVPFTSFHSSRLLAELGQWLEQYQPDVVLVKTFPWLIPEEVLYKPRLGFINFHYAPLPYWRGPNPLFWMIRYQEPKAGVTVHYMDALYDNGPVILQEVIHLHPSITYGLLTTHLAYLGLQMTVMLLEGLLTGTLQSKPQPEEQTGWFLRPVMEDLVINWEAMTAENIHALIRACNPWNKGAATSYAGWTFGITQSTIIAQDKTSYKDFSYGPGTIVSIDEQEGLLIACLEGKLIRVDVVYCEEGFFTGNKLVEFGVKKNDRLGQVAYAATQVIN